MPPVHWAAGAKLPGGINPSHKKIYTATAPGQLSPASALPAAPSAQYENTPGVMSVSRGNCASSGQVSASPRQ